MKKVTLAILISIHFYADSYADDRNLLQNEAKEISLDKVLIKDFSELEYPTYYDRDFWNEVPKNIKEQYIQKAEEYLEYTWPVVKATDYLEIIRSGSRNSHAYAAPRAAVTALVMGELIEGEGRFTDQIVNGVWFYCEQTWWGWSPHLKNGSYPNGLPDPEEKLLDLGVGEITNLLSWTWYLFKDEFDKIHPLISKRLKNEIMTKVVIPYYNREDYWWMGLDIPRKVNNWVPWVNHNMLTAILILEDDQNQKIKGVQKVLKGVDVFLNQYPEDGACDEGPSYWGHAGAALYQNLELLGKATQGKFDLFENQLIKNIGSYIYKAYIEYPYFINFADADAKSGGSAQIVYSYGKVINDPVMQNFGAYLAQQQGWGEKPPGGKIDKQIYQLTLLDEIKNATAKNAQVGEFWFPDTEIAGGRDQEGTSKGFFFAGKGGNNGENHNHNDVGSCVVYYNGKPCLIDIGRETYVAKTFSSERYDIWAMQSQYHNTPKINGEDQVGSREYKAINSTFKSNAKRVTFSTDIAGAYPKSAMVKKWVRTYALERGKRFKIQDNYELLGSGGGPTTLNLMTYCKVTEAINGTLHLEGEDFKLALKYNPEKVLPKIEFYEITDGRLKKYWPEGVSRLVFEIKNPGLSGKNEITLEEIR